MRDANDLDQRIKMGAEASQLLNNRALKAALARVASDLDAKTQSIPATDTAACADIVRSRQILAAFERALMSFIRDGQMARAHLDAMAQDSSPIRRVFRR